MPPRRRTTTAPAALTDDDVAVLRTKVAAGEKPRVIVRVASAAVAAGTRGNVVRFGDPQDNEYVVVRLGRDEVPFAPNELGLSGKPKPAAPSPSPPRPAAPAKAAAVKKTTRSTPTPATTQRRAARPARPSRSGARAAKRSAPPLVVTLRFRDGNWSVEAQRGARRLAKPSPLKPGAVSAFAEHVDEEHVREALVETVESCRAVVEQQAAALRAELQAAEAALRDYDAKPSRRTR